jgi:hypothetical protein
VPPAAARSVPPAAGAEDRDPGGFGPDPAWPTTDALPTAGRFVVWAARNWVRARRGGVDPARALAEGFALAGVAPVRDAFAEVMTVFDARARVPLVFGCPRSAKVFPIERRLIRIIAALQAQRLIDAEAALAGIVPDDLLPAVRDRLGEVAGQMILADLPLRLEDAC